MIAVVNPLGMTPMFLGLTASQDAKEKRRTARRAALTVMAALAAVSIIGGGILTVFGFMMVSDMFSSYPGFYVAENWRTEY